MKVPLLLLLALAGPAWAEGDPLKSPACLAARERLDAEEAAARPSLERLRAVRRQVARDCLQATADPPRPARAAAPQAVAPPPGTQPLRLPPAPVLPPATAPAAPQPAQVQRCDAGGCWDAQGQRLNRAGNHLVDPQGRLCTQQGTVLNCP